MLRDNLYKIDTLTVFNSDICSTITLNSKNEIFRGHFPNNPILPGVCTLAIIREIVEEVTHRKLTFFNIADCKFLSVITPSKDKNVEVNITLKDNDALTAVVSYDSVVALKLKTKVRDRV